MTIDEAARVFTELDENRPRQFDELAEAVFSFQRSENPVYSRYCKSIFPDAAEAGILPHLPIAAFKQAEVTTFAPSQAERMFESTGTGRGTRSRHYVKDLSLYDRSLETHFEKVFGPGPFVFATHLPHYSKMGDRSSLLYMVEHLVTTYGWPGSGSFLEDPRKLDEYVDRSLAEETPLIVFGTAFGLLDFVEAGGRPLPPNALVIETGGMKTYRREISRRELHQALADGFGILREQIRSEYGMCELLTQCYTRGNEVFYPPPWLRFKVFDPLDPFREVRDGEAGMLGVFDSANIYTVSAILTEDRAVRKGGGFEVLGRLTGTELRGCNFLLESV